MGVAMRAIGLGGLREEEAGSLFSHLVLETGAQACRSPERLRNLQRLTRIPLRPDCQGHCRALKALQDAQHPFQ